MFASGTTLTGLLDKTELEDEKERCMVRKEDPPGLDALLLLVVDLEVAEVDESELMPMMKGESSAGKRKGCTVPKSLF